MIIVAKSTLEEKTQELPIPRVNVYVGYPLYDQIEEAAKGEPVRGLSAFVLEVFRYGFEIYRRVGSLKDLKKLGRLGESAGTGELKITLASRKDLPIKKQIQLIDAVAILLERAPAEKIRSLAEDLSKRAGELPDRP